MLRLTTVTWGLLFALTCALAAGCGSDDAGAGGGAGGAGPAGGAGGSGGSEASDAAGGGDAGGTTGGTGGSAGGGGTQQLDAGPDAPAVETELVHMVGRFDDTDPSRPTSSWSGTSFATRLSGSDLSVRLGGAAEVYFEVDIDGQSAGRFETTGGDQSYAVASGLGAGEHDVLIVRRNEGFFGNVEFLGFEPGAGATLVQTPRPYVHKMELIGDSLTAGYGIEGADANCNFSGDTESFYGTYGFIAARNVGAEAHAIAYSGKGVFQNYGGDTTELMGELWPRTLTNDPSSQWDFTQFEPEAVVINLGTNDFSAPLGESDFVGAYAAFLGQVRSHYPAAMIFCVTWAHWGATDEGWVEEAMSQTGDANLRHLQFSIDPADGYGCDWHTNLVTNAKLAVVLTEALQTELGW